MHWTRQSAGDKVFGILNGTIMIIFSFLCIYPFVYIGVLSLNDAIDAQRGGIYFWPRVFSLQNYGALFQNDTIITAYGISVARVLLSIVSQVLLNAMFAHAITKKSFFAREFLKWWILIPMYFGGGLLPYYMILYYTHMINAFRTYIVPALYGSFWIILLMTNIKEIPQSLEESATIDGASEFKIFFQIILPLIKPVLAAIALFVGVGAWNDWFTGYTFITNTKLWCAQNVLLFIMQSNEPANLAIAAKLHKGAKITVTPESIKMAMLMVTTIPIICIYPFLQKYFVKGVMIGSIKE